MPYTFGAATSHRISFSANVSAIAANHFFVSGWWMPTTLTATRGLWTAGQTAGCTIDTTTTDILLTTDNTTDGKWTAPVGLTVNQWSFLAMAVTLSGATIDWRVWAGSMGIAPVEVAVTQTVAPVGSATGNSTWNVGNVGSGAATLAFQGDISHVVFVYNTSDSPCSPLSAATLGTWTQAEADLIAQHLVQPLWLGDYNKIADLGHLVTNAPNTRWFEELNGAQMFGRGNDITTPPFAVSTVSGAVLTQGNLPRAVLTRPSWPLKRR